MHFRPREHFLGRQAPRGHGTRHTRCHEERRVTARVLADARYARVCLLQRLDCDSCAVFFSQPEEAHAFRWARGVVWVHGLLEVRSEGLKASQVGHEDSEFEKSTVAANRRSCTHQRKPLSKPWIVVRAFWSGL